jgi:phosphoribosyl 1,2-cyclic phosphodiesterase
LKIRILGSAPGKPVSGKNHACIWCLTHDRNILFDCGEGASQQLMKFKLDKDQIDSIIISHMHPDHVSGIYQVLLMFKLNERISELRIFLPEQEDEFAKTLELFYLFKQLMPFKIRIKNIENLDMNWIIPLKNDHLQKYKKLVKEQGLKNKMLSYSFIISEKDKKLIYTSDVNTLDFVKNNLGEGDLVILDSVHPVYEELEQNIKDHRFRFIINHGLSDAMKKLLPLISRERYDFADEEKEIQL